MRTNYQPPITTLAEVRSLWRYLGAASQCTLLRDFDLEPMETDAGRLAQIEWLWKLIGEDDERYICEFVEEVADTVRGNV